MGIVHSQDNDFSYDDYIASFAQLKKGLESISLDISEDDAIVLKTLFSILDIDNKNDN